MKKLGISSALFLFSILVCQVNAQPGVLLPPVQEGAAQPGGKVDPKQKDKDKDKDKKQPEKKVEQPQSNVFADTFRPSGEVGRGFHPQMLGDFPGKFVRRPVTIFGTVTVTTVDSGPSLPVTTTTVTPTTRTSTGVRHYPIFGAFKVAENASPRPQDRVFGSYHYYNDLRSSQPTTITPTTVRTSTTSRNGAITTTTITTETTPGVPYANLHRETFGFEKTFLNGFASIEVRVPVVQQPSSVDSFAFHHVGDVTIIGKYAFILDPQTGNVLSAGLAVTAPTGPGVDTIDGNIHATLLQPWFGYIWNADRFYVQGFHSVVVPTDSRDVTLLFNDIGVNYWLYRTDDPSRILRFVVPSAEVHVTTPLNQRGDDAAFFVPDTVVLTGGFHVGAGRSTFSFGVAAPITGPQPFNFEGFAQYNFRW